MKIRPVLAVFVLSLILFVSFFGFNGTHLCFGKDGHVAIEFVDAYISSGDGLQAAPMEESSYCGNCMDVQFPNSPIYVKYIRNVSGYTQTLSLISFPAALQSLLKEFSGSHVNLPVLLHHKTLRSLYSVVLLI